MRVIGSSIFAAAVGLACVGMGRSGGLVWRVNQDGTLEYFKDSSGSMVGMDEWLLMVGYLIPSAIIRVIRAGKRPALLEIGLFALVLYALGVSYYEVGTDLLLGTIEATGDRWLAAGLIGAGGAILVFCLLTAEGWLIRRRA